MSASEDMIKAVELLPSDAPMRGDSEDSQQAMTSMSRPFGNDKPPIANSPHPGSDPRPKTFLDIYNHVSELDKAKTNPSVRLRAIWDSLKEGVKTNGTPEDAEKLGDYAAATIALRSKTESSDDNATTADTPEDHDDTIQRVIALARPGLEILRICTNEPAVTFTTDTLVTLIPFTTLLAPSQSPTGACVNPEYTVLGDLARGVLAEQLARRSGGAEALVTSLLQDYLPPLFSKSRPSAVTASGRKAAFQDEEDAARGLRDETGEFKPWKYLDHRAIAVFKWAVNEASETLISKQWPMFIPVLLTLLDDTTTRVRHAGLTILPTFLSKFPDRILHDSGLASVFEDAVFPTLNFLPSITPEDESVQLLPPAYRSLLLLSSKLQDRVKPSPNVSRTPRARLLNRILREGVFSGYSHAKQYVRVADVLFEVTKDLVDELGIHAVPHLKDLIPMHCGVMTDPFALAAPGHLVIVLTSLVAVFTNCWTCLRNGPYQDELIKAVVTCFLNVHDSITMETWRQQYATETLKTLASMLCTLGTAHGGSDVHNKVAPLIAQEPLLSTLFIDSS